MNNTAYVLMGFWFHPESKERREWPLAVYFNLEEAQRHADLLVKATDKLSKTPGSVLFQNNHYTFEISAAPVLQKAPTEDLSTLFG
jgi:hypothetical protein